MPPIFDENVMPNSAFRTPSLPAKTAKPIRHLRSASTLVPSGIRAPTPLATKKSFDMNSSLLDADRSVGLDKSTMKDTNDLGLCKVQELEKAMRVVQRGLKVAEGTLKAHDHKADSRMMALENRVASLETSFERFQVQYARSSSPANITSSPARVPSAGQITPAVTEPGSPSRTRVAESLGCASPPVPALRVREASKRASWAHGADADFQRWLFEGESNPFGNRRGSTPRQMSTPAQATQTSIGEDQVLPPSPIVAPPHDSTPALPSKFDQSILDAIASLESRASSSDGRLAQFEDDKISMQCQIDALQLQISEQEIAHKSRSDDILALREEIAILQSSIPPPAPAPAPTAAAVGSVEQDFARLYLMELQRREAVDAEVQALQDQLAVLQSLNSPYAASASHLETSERGTSNQVGREECGSCNSCDSSDEVDAGDISLIDASL